jgi:hypothetical protein
MRLVDGQPVEHSYFEYGVRNDVDVVSECADEGSARMTAEFYGGKLVRQRIYVMEWEDVPEAVEPPAALPDDSQDNVPELGSGQI